jgi:hypothetical protein
LVGSLRLNGGDPRIILVDYGSKKIYSDKYVEITRALGIDYEKMHAEGWPWNKCHAINRGAKLAEGNYVSTVDVDVFFTSDPFGFCLKQETKKKMFHINSYWMREKGDERTAIPAGHGTPGMFQFIETKAFQESGGYDERIVYWGLEDLDWPARLLACGYEQVWLPEPHRIYHQWHRPSESGKLRPETASFNTMRYCFENRINPVLKQEWGKSLGLADRPILSLLKKAKPVEVPLATNAFMRIESLQILLDSRKSGGFVKLGLGPRLVKRPLSRFARAAKSMLRPISASVGLDCREKTNCNFDYFYAMLPALIENGLRDYFLSKDLSEVYLLWKD